MLLSIHFEPFRLSQSKVEIKHDFFKNQEVLLEKLIQDNLELVFFCFFNILPTGFRAWKAKNPLNLAREFCRNFVEQNLNENKSSDTLAGLCHTQSAQSSTLSFAENYPGNYQSTVTL